MSTAKASETTPTSVGLWPLVGYFLKLGTTGFGGPTALVGYMLRDLVQQRRWITEDEYKLSLALAQIMPGPLAAQCAMAIGYFKFGVWGSTLTGLAFVLPSFFMVLAISVLYVAYNGLWWVQALFYGIAPAVLAVIAIAAYRLSRSINKRDPLLWGVFLVLAVVTAVAEAELAVFFLLAGLLVMAVRTRAGWLPQRAALFLPLGFGAPAAAIAPAAAPVTGDLLAQITVFFAKASAFVFGSGLAIIPFLHQSVVLDFGWLNEHQFLDAIAIALITPGPVVITVAFIGYLVAGPLGSLAAAAGMFLPTYLLTVVPAPWFKRHRDNVYLKGFVEGSTAAATGAIAGAVLVLTRRSDLDVITIAIGIVCLAVLWRWRVPEPYVVLSTGAAGLVLWPLVRAQ
jgi:chromate transporter